jgi:hypothetical protein
MDTYWKEISRLEESIERNQDISFTVKLLEELKKGKLLTSNLLSSILNSCQTMDVDNSYKAWDILHELAAKEVNR